MLKTCKRCGSAERNTAGRCAQCQRRVKRDYMRKVRVSDPAKYARWTAAPYQLSDEQRARKYEQRRQRGRARELEQRKERMRTDPAYAAKVQRQQRNSRRLPMETRPCPQLCEWAGCVRAATTLDHCHDTGAFRGWLCREHNVGLGKIGDNAAALRAGLDYLARAESEVWLIR